MNSMEARRTKLDRIVIRNRIGELQTLIKRFEGQRDSTSRRLCAGWSAELVEKRGLQLDLREGVPVSRRDIQHRAPIATVLSRPLTRERRGSNQPKNEEEPT